MLNLTMIIALASFAAGAAGSFLITDWWNGISYSSAVADAVKDQKAKQAKSEAILKAQIEEKQKTRIVYRTIRSKANEIHVYRPCLNTPQLSLWNDATAAANRTETSKPNGAVRAITEAIKAGRSKRTPESH